MVNNDLLPKTWKLPAIENIADVNPRLDKSAIDDDLLVSFREFQQGELAKQHYEKTLKTIEN